MVSSNKLKTTSYDLFIFDFDGTLADSRRHIANGVNFALEKHGLAAVDPARVYAQIGKYPIEATFASFYRDLALEQVEALVSDFRQYQRDHVQQELAFFPGVIATLDALKANGKQLAILTTKHITQIDYILNVFGLRALFDVVYGDGLIPERKPERACVEYILRSVPTPVYRHRCVIVGDSEVDVRAAQNSGLDMIAVGHGVDSMGTLLEKGAHYGIDVFSELLNFC